MGGFPSPAEMEKRLAGPKGKKGRKAKGVRLYLRYDPDDLSKRDRVERDDIRYDEWLTAAQARTASAKDKKEKEKDGETEDTFVGSLKKELGRSIGQKVGRSGRKGKVGLAAAKRLGSRTGTVVKSALGTSGLGKGLVSALTKVAPLALRLTAVGAAIGAVWWVGNTLWERAVQKKVEAAIAAGEARLKRAYTDAELAALLPQYRAWFKNPKVTIDPPKWSK
jgi:hypothetical protein